MKQKTITVKAAATIATGTKYQEFEWPEVNKALEDGWLIKEVIHTPTNTNVAFVFITYILFKN